MEIHCRGQCPQFLFNVFECDQCPEILIALQKNAWLKSEVICREDWDTFLCRVKRTPINSHQFVSYNGTEKPKNCDEINHVLIIRGDKQPNKLRACSRGCTFTDISHSNNITIETELQGDPTLQTQVTQPASN
uniref:Uncharacterized protein n=1 Tax=Panagrolaimus superbus TaxID=310955 RepID=A0A914YKK8_9BILA